MGSYGLKSVKQTYSYHIFYSKPIIYQRKMALFFRCLSDTIFPKCHCWRNSNVYVGDCIRSVYWARCSNMLEYRPSIQRYDIFFQIDYLPWTGIEFLQY